MEDERRRRRDGRKRWMEGRGKPGGAGGGEMGEGRGKRDGNETVFDTHDAYICRIPSSRTGHTGHTRGRLRARACTQTHSTGDSAGTCHEEPLYPSSTTRGPAGTDPPPPATTAWCTYTCARLRLVFFACLPPASRGFSRKAGPSPADPAGAGQEIAMRSSARSGGGDGGRGAAPGPRNPAPGPATPPAARPTCLT